MVDRVYTLANIDQFVRDSEEKLVSLAQRAVTDMALSIEPIEGVTSAQRVGDPGQVIEGRIPVVTGELFQSFIVEVNGQITASGIENTAAGLETIGPGDRIVIGWTADHAPYIEFGTSRIRPRRFAGIAAARWREFVEKAASEISRE